MNLTAVLATLSVASSVAVSSTPVEKQLLSISPHDFAQKFNVAAQEAGAKLTLPEFAAKPGWHRAHTSQGVSVLVRAAQTGHALDEVIVVCRAVEQCMMTICTAARAIDTSVDPNLLQYFVAARVAAQLGEVALVMSGLVYLVVNPDDQDYVAVVIRPYQPQQELTARRQAALRTPAGQV
ncbi:MULTISPECIES: malto-oligosyltrehalose synthase [Cupriavidus]|uniref:Malto-oligosyltrehalose synthase n=1 Tax=Cupriavidus pauculus TaxID=82633 RepID=A0A3G8H9H9_9BURK|nr:MULTISPECIES: malto-oligosyltrehalose synthase [Cupriavidus]AZG16915.1 malto-oligosyltrehalose synthase [Cupriavidus pauculus]MDT6961820.1 malto-oligosyltrehalose synthase [Cupriavidus sp. SZY C1]